ncbi:MAG: iron-sulfur cluster assembly accessory protein [Opitutaceae bacterium]|nr:iron-sulfur cluster assembly accessory protein [Cytophagales bacterium]
MFKEIPLKISTQAISQIKYIFERKNIPSDYGLRIGMKGSGCAGTSFIIGFDTKKAGDDEYEIDNIPVYIEKKHVMYLYGVQVDFVENEVESGFVFNT